MAYTHVGTKYIKRPWHFENFLEFWSTLMYMSSRNTGGWILLTLFSHLGYFWCVFYCLCFGLVCVFFSCCRSRGEELMCMPSGSWRSDQWLCCQIIDRADLFADSQFLGRLINKTCTTRAFLTHSSGCSPSRGHGWYLSEYFQYLRHI